jgi:hypothetical protein
MGSYTFHVKDDDAKPLMEAFGLSVRPDSCVVITGSDDNFLIISTKQDGIIFSVQEEVGAAVFKKQRGSGLAEVWIVSSFADMADSKDILRPGKHGEDDRYIPAYESYEGFGAVRAKAFSVIETASEYMELNEPRILIPEVFKL